MYLPKNDEKQKGQILIIFLLILVVAVAIVLSLASRSFTDVASTDTSDQSNRAYFAAEAGIESALKKISGSTGDVAFDLDFTNVNKTTARVNATPFLSGTDELYAFPSNVSRDDIAQVALLNDFNNLGSGSYGGNLLTIYWGNSNVDIMAIEASLVYLDAGNFRVAKWGLDPSGRNGFCGDVSVVQTGGTLFAGNLGINVTYQYKATINIRNGNYGGGGFVSGGCQDQGLTMNSPVLLRIRTLYNNSSQPVGVLPEAGRALPQQGFLVESSGSTDSGVTRKLRVIQPYPALPAIFDYVLFSGGADLQK